MRYVDIHAHPSFGAFDSDREAVLSRMREAGVVAFGVGVDLVSSKKEVALAGQHEHLFATVGLHPIDNLEETFDAAAYRDLARHPKVVAIGECGLDFYRREKTPEEGERQRTRFLAQLTLAVELGKPLMIHCREAHEEMLAILAEQKREHGERLRGNIHFFTATADIARRYGELGFTVSFPGVITFAKELEDVVRAVPLSSMHAETDCPFAAPITYRGRRNEPLFVQEVVKGIARIRGEELEVVERTLRENAARVFALPLIA